MERRDSSCLYSSKFFQKIRCGDAFAVGNEVDPLDDDGATFLDHDHDYNDIHYDEKSYKLKKDCSLLCSSPISLTASLLIVGVIIVLVLIAIFEVLRYRRRMQAIRRHGPMAAIRTTSSVHWLFAAGTASGRSGRSVAPSAPSAPLPYMTNSEPPSYDELFLKDEDLPTFEQAQKQSHPSPPGYGDPERASTAVQPTPNDTAK